MVLFVRSSTVLFTQSFISLLKSCSASSIIIAALASVSESGDQFCCGGCCCQYKNQVILAIATAVHSDTYYSFEFKSCSWVLLLPLNAGCTDLHRTEKDSIDDYLYIHYIYLYPLGMRYIVYLQWMFQREYKGKENVI
jgi:hypothetical protein